MSYVTQRGKATETVPYRFIKMRDRELILRDYLENGCQFVKEKWNISSRTVQHIKFHYKKLLRRIEDENLDRLI